MLLIYIHGINNGDHQIELSEKLDTVPDLRYKEFFGELKFIGIMKKSGKRFNVIGVAKASARLICDRTLKEYNEEIQIEVNLSYLADTRLYLANKGKVIEEEENYIHEDDKNLDITYEVLELLELHLPMKRISPEFRNKEIDEIFPEHSARFMQNNKVEIDDRWSNLKNLKLN